MEAVNMLRAVLVGGAVIAALVAAAHGLWLTTAILAVGLAAHAALWIRLHRDVDRPSARPPFELR